MFKSLVDDISNEQPIEVRALPRKKVKKTEITPRQIKEAKEVSVALIEESSTQEENNSNPGSLKKKMAASMKYFAPDLVGGLIGGIFGGVEGAVAGMGSGQEIRNQLTENQFNIARLDLQRQQFGRAQRTRNIVHKDTGQPLSARDAGGFLEYLDPAGNVIDPSKVEHLGATRADLSAGRLNLSGQRFDFTREEALDLNPVDTRFVADANATLGQVEGLTNLFSDVTIGPAVGRAQSITQVWTGKSAPQFTKLKTRTELLLQQYGKFISGTAMSDEEKARLENTLPSVNDSPQNFLIKAQEFERLVNMQKQARLDAAERLQGKTGNPSYKPRKEMSSKRKRLEELRRKKAGK